MGVRSFTACDLLVEPLDAHPKLEALRDFTRHVGWAARCDVGHLEWDDPQGLACAFCHALVLPSEAQRISGAVGCVCGRLCCAKGCALCAVQPWLGRAAC